MTVLIAIFVVGGMLAGVILFIYALSQRVTPDGTKGCPRCQTGNPQRARFCAHCGQELP